MEEVYRQLAHFLDDLPAGFPPSASGVELRLLQKLFAPAEAGLAMCLTLLNEEARVVAYRAHQPVDKVAKMLEQMEAKGLIAADHTPGKPTRYAVSQFVVGFMEDQVNRLDLELVTLVDEYLPTFFKEGPWTQLPQIRTIPVGETIPLTTEVMPYEVAEAILQSHTTFAVRNCVCRQGRQISGKGCDAPLETCLSFGGAAKNTVASGKGRFITRVEALAIIHAADAARLVLQPANSKDPMFICACCGCCCGILRHLKFHEKPASLVANAYIASFDPSLCATCLTCTERCQMEAITYIDWAIAFNPDRCIGCGLCVSTCDTGALTLMRKSEPVSIPRNTASTYVRLAQKRGKLKPSDLVSIALKSTVDRLMAPRK